MSTTNAPMTITEWETTYGGDRAREGVGEGERWELVRGVPVMSPPEGFPNRDAAGMLIRCLAPYLDVGQWFMATDPGLSLPSRSGLRDSVLVPDVAIGRRRPGMGQYLTRGDIALVVEVVSPSSARRDRVTKRGEYAAAGIPAYLIIDPASAEAPLVLHTEPVSIGSPRSTSSGADYTGTSEGTQVTVTLGEAVIKIRAADLLL